MCHIGLFWSFFIIISNSIIIIKSPLSSSSSSVWAKKMRSDWHFCLCHPLIEVNALTHTHTSTCMHFKWVILRARDCVCTMTKIYNSAHAHYNFQWILSVTAQWAVSPKQQMTAKICLCEREIDQDDNFGIRKKTIRNEIDTATTAWATTAATASVKFISKFPPVYVVSACLKICFRSVIISFFPPVAHAFFAKERLRKTSKCTHTNSL